MHTQQIRQLEIDPGDGSNPSKSNASGRMNRIIQQKTKKQMILERLKHYLTKRRNINIRSILTNAEK